MNYIVCCCDSAAVLQAKKTFPRERSACMALFGSAELTQHELDKMVLDAEFAVLTDLSSYAAKIAGLESKNQKRKLDTEVNVEPGAVVKVEPGAHVKVEPGAVVKAEPPEEVKVEPQCDALMSKSQLMEKHGLKKLEKGAHGKSFPLFCSSCRKTFCGRNKAKILQHTGTQEHQRRRNQDESSQKVKMEPEPLPEKVMPKQEGLCLGLRLRNCLGQTSRLVEQLRSPLRTVMFGSKWCDPSALLDLGLLVSSYVGSDTISDLQAALLPLGSTFPC